VWIHISEIVIFIALVLFPTQKFAVLVSKFRWNKYLRWHAFCAKYILFTINWIRRIEDAAHNQQDFFHPWYVD